MARCTTQTLLQNFTDSIYSDAFSSHLHRVGPPAILLCPAKLYQYA